jgi:hypothetical protein
MAMIRRGKSAVAFLVAGLLAAPAIAQEAPSQARFEEMSCVYNGVSRLDDDDFFAIADMHLSKTYDGADSARLTGLVEAETAACVTRHGWDEKRKGYAAEMALQGVISDTLATDMMDLGLTEAQMLTMEGLLETMSDANFTRLYDRTWVAKSGERAELDKLWLANGIPQDEAILERLPVYLGASIIVGRFMDRWMAEYPE